MLDIESLQEDLRAWLKDPVRRNIISITAIERQAQIPASSLMKFINGNRWLPYNHQESLIKVLNAIGYVRPPGKL